MTFEKTISFHLVVGGEGGGLYAAFVGKVLEAF